MPTPGLSFSPTSESPFDQDGGGGQTNPVQQAIQLLSYRLPQVVGAGAIAPQSLLSPGGGQGSALGSQVGSAVAEQWLRKLFMGGGDIGGPAPMGAPQGQPQGQPSNPYMNWMNNEQGHGLMPSAPPARAQRPVIGYEDEQPGFGRGPTLQPTQQNTEPPPQQPSPWGNGGIGRRGPIVWGA